MFRLMCPECGRDLATVDKDCPDCDVVAPAQVRSFVAHPAMAASLPPPTTQLRDESGPALSSTLKPPRLPAADGRGVPIPLAPRLSAIVPLRLEGNAAGKPQAMAGRPLSALAQPLRVFLPKQPFRQYVQPVRIPWSAPPPVGLALPPPAQASLQVRAHPLRMMPIQLPKPRLQSSGPQGITGSSGSAGLADAARRNPLFEPECCPRLLALGLSYPVCAPRLPVAAAARYTAAVVVPGSIARMTLAMGLPAGGLTSYTAAAGRLMRHAVIPPRPQGLQGAPVFNLPGPMLVRGLLTFTDRALRPVFPGKMTKKTQWPVWLAGTLIVGTLLGAGFANLFPVASKPLPAPGAVSRGGASGEPPATHTGIDRASGSQPSAAEASAAGHVSAGKTWLDQPLLEGGGSVPTSLARSIEVSGFRFQINTGHRPEIHYVFVNHSPARLSGLTVYVTLRAADAPVGQPPLCQFSFETPDIAPYEARPMVSPLPLTRKQVALPDWQELRAELQVGR